VAGCGKISREAAKARRGLLWHIAHLIINEASILGQMMNSFYWTQTALVLAGAVLAFFISFGPNRNRTKWLTAIGIAASVALFVANQVVMSNTGDGLDKQLNCWIWPTGVACPKPRNSTQLTTPTAESPASNVSPAKPIEISNAIGRGGNLELGIKNKPCSVGRHKIYFDGNKDIIATENFDALEDAVENYKNCIGADIILSTDEGTPGDHENERNLSQRRLTAVRAYLERRGLPSNNIITIDLGEAKSNILSFAVRDLDRRFIEISFTYTSND
jgi:outer membrane protein OmpA-like peptidoglycan-associated protein